MKPSLYLETSVPSYLTSRPSRDLIVAGHQQITREWWETRRNHFELYISELVLSESSAGDTTAARCRLDAIEHLPLLTITPEVGQLADSILASGKVPRKAATDVAHIAVAAVHGMNFLITWNCVHIANAIIVKSVVAICRNHGYECPVICTPEALLWE